jgi:hypothetical protein
MSNQISKIVVDGEDRYRAARGYWAIRRRVMTEVALRYREEKKKSPLWRRLWLEVKISREVAVRMKKEFPPGSLYISLPRMNDGGLLREEPVSRRSLFQSPDP